MDFVERYVTVRLYRLVFCSPSTDDEDKDLAIQDKIRKLHWMNAYLLDAQLDERKPEVREFVDQAITGVTSHHLPKSNCTFTFVFFRLFVFQKSLK